MIRRTVLRGLSSSGYIPPHTPGKFQIAEPEAPAKDTELPKESEYFIIGHSRPGRIPRHNFGVAACGVVPRGINTWGFPTKQFLLEQSNGQMTLMGKGGPTLEMDDDDVIEAVQEMLSDGTDLYGVFGTLGSYRNACLPVGFVTDSADAALVAQYLLHPVPDNDKHETPRGPIHVIHSSRVSDIAMLSYEDADTRANIAVGANTSVATIMEALVQAGSDLAPEAALSVASTVLEGEGGSTLIVGAEEGSTDVLYSSGKLYSAGGAMIHPDGVSAMFDSALLSSTTGTGDELRLADGSALVRLNSPNLAFSPSQVALVGASGSLDEATAVEAFEKMTNSADADLYKKLLSGVPAKGVGSAREAM